MVLNMGQVDSPELSKTLEITEMMENFTKVTKYLTKFKEILINCLGKISCQKAVRIKFSVDFGFSSMFYIATIENPEMLETNRKLSKSKKHPVLTFYSY